VVCVDGCLVGSVQRHGSLRPQLLLRTHLGVPSLPLRLGVNTAPSGNYWLKTSGLGIAKRMRSDGQARDFLAVSTLSQSHVAGVGRVEVATYESWPFLMQYIL
jgi:hypothetical protein